MTTAPYQYAPRLIETGGGGSITDSSLELRYASGTGSKDIPLVLAGPIVRRVTHDSVTVWVAVRKSCTVVLEVIEPSDGPTGELPMRGSQDTIRIGKHIHVAAVTATPIQSSWTPNSDVVYEYTMSFDGVDLGQQGVLRAGQSGNDPITLGSRLLPTLTFPASDLDDLRIAYGSCRKAHGPGPDALPAVYDMLADNANDAAKRPNHLLLGGDQIYGDDLADQLLGMITNHANVLLGWEERMPDGTKLSDKTPGRRESYVTNTGGLSAIGYGSSHVMGLGEYFAMYLCAWSDVLWPTDPGSASGFASDFPSLDDLFSGVGSLSAEAKKTTKMTYRSKKHTITEMEELFEENITNLHAYRETLATVRKVLANVPTYMIFDDHDVTDDWFISGNWVKQVLGSSGDGGEAVGKRIVQNGMLAYAVFQAWGNTPEQFDGTDSPGFHLLVYLDHISHPNRRSQPHTQRTEKPNFHLDTTLGMPLLDGNGEIEYRQDQSAPSHGTMDWHYYVHFGAGGPFADYELVVFDTRTWRHYVDDVSPPEVISDEGLAIQRPDIGYSVDLTIAVSAVPPWTVPLVDLGQEGQALYREYVHGLMDRAAQEITGVKQRKRGASPTEYSDMEHWRFQPTALERFVSMLTTTQLTGQTSPPYRSRVVVLSGDVHHGFTNRLQYWGDNPYVSSHQRSTYWSGEPIQPYKDGQGPVEAVFANLVSSPSKNTELKVELLHAFGHALRKYNPSFGYGGVNVESWFEKFASYSPSNLTTHRDVDNGLMRWTYSLHPFVLDKLDVNEYWDIIEGLDYLDDAFRDSDWVYRVDYLQAEHSPTPTKRSKQEILNLLKQTGLIDVIDEDHYLNNLEFGSEVVGRNNVGDVTFTWTNQEKRVTHELWWRLYGGSPGQFSAAQPLSRWEVSLDFDGIDRPDDVIAQVKQRVSGGQP